MAVQRRPRPGQDRGTRFRRPTRTWPRSSGVTSFSRGSDLRSVGGAAIALYFAVPESQPALYVLIGLAAAAAIVVGCRIHRVRMAGWSALAAGLALYSIGDLVYTIIVATTGDGAVPVGRGRAVPGRPGPRRRRRRAASPGRSSRGLYRPAVIDAALVATAGAFIAWPIAPGPAGRSTLVEPVTGLRRPVVPGRSISSSSACSRGTSCSRAGGTPSILLMSAGVAVWLVADLAYVRHVADRRVLSRAMRLDAGWLIAYVIVGAAALHPSMAQVVSVSTNARGDHLEPPARPDRPAVAVPVVAFIVHGPLDHAVDFAVFASVRRGACCSRAVAAAGSLRASRVLLEEQRALQSSSTAGRGRID